jgi:hypothetical protein
MDIVSLISTPMIRFNDEPPRTYIHERLTERSSHKEVRTSPISQYISCATPLQSRLYAEQYQEHGTLVRE